MTILPGAIRIWEQQPAGLKKPESFLADNPGWCRATCQGIEAMQSKGDLATLLEDELKPRSLESFWQNYATALRYGECVGKLRRELLELVGPGNADALLSNVSRQDELLASLGPVVGLARLARGGRHRHGGTIVPRGHRRPRVGHPGRGQPR